MGSIPVAGAKTKGLPKGGPFVLAPAQAKPLCKRSEAELGSHISSEDRQARLSGVGRGYIRHRRNSLLINPYTHKERQNRSFAVLVCFLL